MFKVPKHLLDTDLLPLLQFLIPQLHTLNDPFKLIAAFISVTFLIPFVVTQTFIWENFEVLIMPTLLMLLPDIALGYYNTQIIYN